MAGNGQTQHMEVPADSHEAASVRDPDLIRVSGPLAVLTWAVFLVMAFVLYRIAWKPILRGLDARENSIRKALEEAEKARAELAASQERAKQLVAEAEAQRREAIEAAQTAATLMADRIRADAQADAASLVEGARREIRSAVDKARSDLRRETADLAIAIAGTVIRENMDDARNRRLVDALMEEVNP